MPPLAVDEGLLPQPEEMSVKPPKISPRTSARKKIQVRNMSDYSMCTSAKEKVALYCSNTGKPEPIYRHKDAGGKLVRAEVYVAKTCGRVTGEAKPTSTEAEENVAEILARKLHLY